MYDPQRHHRRSIRLKGWDYATSAAYFVTICVQGRVCSLGAIEGDEMVLSDFGKIANETIQWLSEQYAYVEIDCYVVMPNHIHVILVLRSLDDQTVKRKPLGQLLGAFKTTSTSEINLLRDGTGNKFWQRNFYEHIVRNDRVLNAIRDYIISNPATWEDDKLHPNAPPNKFNRDLPTDRNFP